jgi:transposase-like protein
MRDSEINAVNHGGSIAMSQKSKVSIEEKVRMVRMYLAGKVSMNGLAQTFGVNWYTAAAWVRNYEAEGPDAFLSGKHHTYSQEVKRQAVEEYQRSNASLSDICKKYKIRSRKTLRMWIKVYNTHGDFNSVKTSGGGSYMRQGRDTTLEERIQIVRDCIASGKNYGEMALKYQVSYQQVRTWTLRFEEKGEAGLEDRRGRRKKDQTPRTELEQAQIEIEQLKHKLYLAEMENALLKKLDEVERRDAFRK